MNVVDMLALQTQDAYDWTNKLLDSIPHERWERIPPVIESNVTWQAGHLIISFYYHSIMSVAGHQTDILTKIPVKEYAGLFNNKSPLDAPAHITPLVLLEQLQFVQQRSMEVIRSLQVEDLSQPLHTAAGKHPVATTRYEAIDWNIKHTFWHCGQLGILKRIVHERYDFGLTM